LHFAANVVKQMRELKARMTLNSLRKVVKELEFLILGIRLVLQYFFPNLNFDDQEPIKVFITRIFWIDIFLDFPRKVMFILKNITFIL